MKRRKLLLSGAAAALARAAPAGAQPGEPVRRIGILLPSVADDAQWLARLGAFLKALEQLGWAADRNLRVDTRWATTDTAELRRQAADLASLAPDVILAVGTSSTGPLLQATRAVPIVFTIVNVRWVAGLLTAWRGRAVTPRDSPRSTSALARNGWS